MRRRIGIGTGVYILTCYILKAVFEGTAPGPLLFTLLFQLPLLAPAAIYYFRVSHPTAILICGVLLAVVWIPTGALMYFYDSPPYFLVGAALFGTLVSSSAGALIKPQGAERAG